MRVLAPMLLVALVPALVPAADGAKSPPAGWKEFNPKTKAYVAWFPEDAKVLESEKSFLVEKAGQVRTRVALAERKDGSVLAVTQLNLPPALANPRMAKQRHEILRDHFVNEIGGKVVSEKAVMTGTMAGKEYFIKAPKGMARYRLYGSGVVMYRVVLLGSKEQVEAKDADTFMEGFAHVPIGGPPPAKAGPPGTTSLPGVGGVVVTADGKTLIVTVPSAAQLVYYDTFTEKQTRKVDLDFQPSVIALQGKTLFVAANGASVIHALDAETGKERKECKVTGGAVERIACHPVRGLVYASNAALEIFSIDPEALTVVKTKGRGLDVAVDPANPATVYGCINKSIKSKLIIDSLPGGRFKVEEVKGRLENMLVRYSVDGTDLKMEAGNPVAGGGMSSFGVSRDGKKIAIAGPYQDAAKRAISFDNAVWDTSDLTTLQGKLENKEFPKAIAFHPQLDIVVTLSAGRLGGINVFNSRSLVKKETLKVSDRAEVKCHLTFGARGTKLVAAIPLRVDGGDERPVSLQFHPLTLTEEQTRSLEEAFGP